MSDVEDLFGRMGTKGFVYRELGREGRDQASGGKWSLLGESIRALRTVTPPKRQPSKTAEEARADDQPYVVAVVSPTGGAGRSTITAGAIQALALLGQRAIALDLDPSNALALSFGSKTDRRIGIAHAGFGRRDSMGLLLEQEAEGAACIPFGECTTVELDALEEAARKDAGWLRELMSSVIPQERDLVIIDTPIQRNPWLKQALDVADEILVVLRPDATALAGLARFDRMLAESLSAEVGVHYLINHYDGRDPLAHDVVAALRLSREERLLPFAIHRDPAVGEAVALERTLGDWALGSQVIGDLSLLAEWIIERRSEAEERSQDLQQQALSASG